MRHRRIIKISIVILSIIGLILPIFLPTVFSTNYTYIINPLLWLFFAIGTIFLLPKESNKYNFNASDIRQLALMGSLIFIVVFFSSGLIVGYANSPYDRSLLGFVKNFWIIGVVAIAQEFVRNAFFKTIVGRRKYFVIIGITIFLSLFDIGLLTIMKSLSSYASLFKLLVKDFLPILIINVFLSYLVYREGVLSALLYKMPYLIVTLLAPIFPENSIAILLIIHAAIPLFVYLRVEKTCYYNSVFGKPLERSVASKVFRILTFSIMIFLVMFTLKLLPIHPMVIATNSMFPAIKRGDVVIISKKDFMDIEVGDIIEYETSKILIVHRVLEVVDTNNQGRLLSTKGDNNQVFDTNYIQEEDYRGKIISIIPKIGYPTLFVKELIDGIKINKNIEVGVDNE